MQRYVVARSEYLLVRFHSLHVAGDIPRRVDRYIRVAAVDLHAEVTGGVGKRAAYRAQAYDAELLSAQLRACEFRFVLLHRLCDIGIGGVLTHPFDTADDVSRGEQHAGYDKLLDGVRVGARSVENDYAFVGAAGCRYVVDSGAGARYGEQLFAEPHVVHRGGADEYGVRILHVLAVYVFFIKNVGAVFGDLVKQLYIIHRLPLRIFLCEFFHERDERFDAFDRHGVVDRGSHATDGTVSLNIFKSGCRRLRREFRVKLGVSRDERYVHHRAVFLLHRRDIIALAVEIVVQHRGFLFVIRLHRLESAHLRDPVEDHTGDIYRPAGRRVVH